MRFSAAVASWVAVSVLAISSGAGLVAQGLRCEYLENPLGIDAASPRLSWILASDDPVARGLSQTAFQIVVASAAQELAQDRADLWDSGKVVSSQTAQLHYAGKPLASGQHCFWKVRSWDQAGTASRWSEPASWEMGLLDPQDWQAKWIGRTDDTASNPAPYLRRVFELKGPVKQARAYISGLGYYELSLNGRKVGDAVLDPGYTRYDRRVLYVTHDITAQLQPGRNAVGVILGNGWQNVHTKGVWNFHEAPWRASPRLLAQLRVDYVDGTSEVITGDESWKVSTGPIVFDSIYGGETYDARLEKNGWDTAGFDDAAWQSAKLLEAPKGKLSAQAMPPIRIDRELKPVKITEPSPGVFIFDIGQNLAGFAKLTVSGPAGTKVRMRYGERLAKDGSLDVADIAQHIVKKWPEQQYQTDTYVLKGSGVETWHARFCYHGFQYVEVTGFPGQPTLDNLRALYIHSDIPQAGKFECSNPMLNRIEQAARWSFLSNLQGIPTDCPHREKNGWTGDAHLAAEQGMFTYFPATIHAKWINDLGDEQRPTGELPGIVPTSGWGYAWGNGPAWDSAFLLIPYYQYIYYGDTENFRRHYDGMKRYVDYLTSRSKDGIVSIGLNDWAPWKTKTPAPITSTAYYYVDARIVALAAGLLGKDEDARHYRELAASVRKAFNARFYKADSGSYDNGSQTALSCAICQGLVEEGDRQRVLENLLAAVEKSNNHIDTGILGAKYLLNALLENGRADVAYRMVAQKDQPSWGWWLEQGATTLWEQWNGSESRNHIMYGDVVAWMYKALAGINPDPQSPGFAHVLIKPHVVGDLTSASGEYDSIRGRIISRWKLNGDEFQLNLILPPNMRATVSLPITAARAPETQGSQIRGPILLPILPADNVRESGKPAAGAVGVKFLRAENGRSVYEVGSGSYVFSGPLAK
ncbi:MAG: family 78 glycoside hydrolase catalytic domain [Tepidisphaeraceae bacterium]